MGSKATGWTLGELSQITGSELVGDPDQRVLRPVPATDGDPDGITFAENQKFLDQALASNVGAVIAPKGTQPSGKPLLLSDSPRVAFFKVLTLADTVHKPAPGVHPTAVVSPEARIDPSATLGPYVVVEGDAEVGAGAHVMAFSFIGPGCKVGPGCLLHPRSTLVLNVVLGERCVIHPGAVLGKEGFGFVWDGKRHVRVPQVGMLDIGPNVEIGSNSCIDRATCGASSIGEGTKIDNLVHIGHNAKIGRNVVLAGQVGMSGSVVIGDGVAMGGQVGVGDHIEVVAGAQIAGKTGITGSITEPGAYFGVPALKTSVAFRIAAALPKLPELIRRVKALEQERGERGD